LYCELINNKDSVINRHILKLTEGTASGDFVLARSLKRGNYHIRAYTKWMRNAGAEYFYNQAIRIGGGQFTSIPLKPGTASKPDIRFFPEGGELINGLRSRVAVKSVSANGLGENISGTITDNSGNEVAVFETQHLGMGVFALMPQPGKTYKANITCADSSKYTIDLPQVQESGFTLAMNNNGVDSLYVKVAANDKLFQSNQNATFYLVAQSGGKIYYTAAAKLVGPVFTTQIVKSRFPSGIVQFTLFSQAGEPLNERVVFVKGNDSLALVLASSEKSYAPRQKVKISLDAKDQDKKSVIANLSVAVINETRAPVDENAESTILNNLLLTSDIKGYLEQPNYYFNKVNDKTRADLDILMLTQGYRRFEWKQVQDNKNAPIAFQAEKDLELSGSIKTPSGKPVPNGKVMLVAIKDAFSTDTLTDVNGDYKFTNLDVSDTGKIVLRARKQNNGDNVTIYVKQPDYPTVMKQKITDDGISTANLTAAEKAAMAKNYEANQKQLKEDSLANRRSLKEVNITANKGPKPDRFNYYGTVYEYDVNMNKITKQYNNVKDALRFAVPGLGIVGDQLIYDTHPAGLVIDNWKHDMKDLVGFSTEEIDNIRIISKGPVVMITTKRFAGTDTVSRRALKEVVIKGHKVVEKPDMSRSANLNGGGNADQILMADKLVSCVILSECLNGKLFGVIFKNGIPYSTRVGGLGLRMAIIYDGNQLDGSLLGTLNAQDIYSIEVLRSGGNLAIYGSNAAGGALIITSKRGSDPSYVTSESPSGLITYAFKGYYKAKVFYSPQYTHPKTDAEPLDLRSTIYWNPDITTDKDGKSSFEFFNSDTKGTYRVVIEGIDESGNLGREVFRYKVE
jgi:hypothetical protein